MKKSYLLIFLTTICFQLLAFEIEGNPKTWEKEDFIGFDKVGDCRSHIGDISSVFTRVENDKLFLRITFDGMYSHKSKVDYFTDEDIQVKLTITTGNTKLFDNIFEINKTSKNEEILSLLRTPEYNLFEMKIDWLIELVTNIRSTKVSLNVSPGSFIDISINELNSNKKSVINDNLTVFKRLGRVSEVSHSKINKNGVKIIVGGETVTIYFDQSLDLHNQKEKISKKVKDLDQKIIGTTGKLKNKSFLKNAPKQIVQKEKKTLIEYKIELKKLNSILNSIKN